ncbi:MAG: AraC family transcriptional regulator [Porticoccaceae bacterium]
MTSTTAVDLADYLPADRATWSGSHAGVAPQTVISTTAYGLATFVNRGDYLQPTTLSVCDSGQRMHLSVWLRDGIEVDHKGRNSVKTGDLVAAYRPEVPWRIDFCSRVHYAGLMLTPDVLCNLAGGQGEAFLGCLRRDGPLRVQRGDLAILRTAGELDAILRTAEGSALLREAKSLELLARLVEAGTREDRAGLTRGERARLDQARDLLLADLSNPPTLTQLARACGLNTFRLKQGFKQRFGQSVYTLYQRERMRVAWDLIASGSVMVAEAGHQLGYTNMSHFAASFRKAFGMLPSEVKRRPCEQINVARSLCGDTMDNPS